MKKLVVGLMIVLAVAAAILMFLVNEVSKIS